MSRALCPVARMTASPAVLFVPPRVLHLDDHAVAPTVLGEEVDDLGVKITSPPACSIVSRIGRHDCGQPVRANVGMCITKIVGSAP